MIIKTLPEYFKILVERSEHKEKLQAFSKGFPDNLIGFTDSTTGETFAVRLNAIRAYYQARTSETRSASIFFERDTRLAYNGKTPDPILPPTEWVQENLSLPSGTNILAFSRSR